MAKKLVFLFVLFLAAETGCVKKSPTSPLTGQWGEATANAFSTGRYGLAGTVFNGEMWAIGGAAGSPDGSVTYYYGDVYSSGNGSTWTKVMTNAPFGGRYGSQVLSYNGKLWLIGGNNNGTLMNDVWSSINGSSWTQVLAASVTGTTTQFSPREDFGALVYNNAMWVIAGFSPGANHNDVWNSTDGVTWNRVLADGAGGTNQFSKRWGIATAVYNNAMWVMTGAYDLASNTNPATVYSDVWTSTTGSVWNRVSLINIFHSMYFGQTSVFNNQIWFTGGCLANYGSQNIADYTTDGINWTGTQGSFPFRFYHLCLSYNNALWVIAGCNDVCQTTNCAVTYLNDVWFTQ